MTTLLSQATAGRTWRDEERRRLLVALGAGASLSSLTNLGLWDKYLNALNVRPSEVLAARLRAYAPEYPPTWAGLKLSGVALSLVDTAPNGQVAAPYSHQFSATGGTAPYTYAVVVGTVPAGLTLSSAGLLSGTPTTAATYAFTVRVTDAAGITFDLALDITIIP